MAHRVYIALGSNLGAREMHIRTALEMLASLPGTQLVAQSGLLETAPVGGPPGQGNYLNGAAEIVTDMLPDQLLAALLRIESDLGRVRRREVRHGPRVIDLDLLLYDDLVCDEPGLTIPHPRMAERTFVLAPLADIAPELFHPIRRCTVRELLARARGAS